MMCYKCVTNFPKNRYVKKFRCFKRKKGIHNISAIDSVLYVLVRIGSVFANGVCAWKKLPWRHFRTERSENADFTYPSASRSFSRALFSMRET